MRLPDMTTAPSWELRRRDFHPLVQQLVSLHPPCRTFTRWAAAAWPGARRVGIPQNAMHDPHASHVKRAADVNDIRELIVRKRVGN